MAMFGEDGCHAQKWVLKSNRRAVINMFVEKNQRTVALYGIENIVVCRPEGAWVNCWWMLVCAGFVQPFLWFGIGRFFFTPGYHLLSRGFLFSPLNQPYFKHNHTAKRQNRCPLQTHANIELQRSFPRTFSSSQTPWPISPLQFRHTFRWTLRLTCLPTIINQVWMHTYVNSSW